MQFNCCFVQNMDSVHPHKCYLPNFAGFIMSRNPYLNNLPGQGGRGPGAYEPNYKPPFHPITHETTYVSGLLHIDGTLSMARTAPGTATTEIFICIGNQPELDFGGKRNPDGQVCIIP